MRQKLVTKKNFKNVQVQKNMQNFKSFSTGVDFYLDISFGSAMDFDEYSDIDKTHGDEGEYEAVEQADDFELKAVVESRVA